jgi:hypothetical protein
MANLGNNLFESTKYQIGFVISDIFTVFVFKSSHFPQHLLFMPLDEYNGLVGHPVRRWPLPSTH